jgi:ATP-dependent DNA helicase DinG
VREEQKKMLLDVAHSFNEKRCALIEAGTGVGKSFAYLVPALLHAHIHQEKVVISTHTIHLQEQLIFKDLPLLIDALGLDIDARLAMGRGNYYCKVRGSGGALEAWSQGKTDGKRSSVPFPVSNGEWEEVMVDPDSCLSMRCPQYNDCFLFNDRKQLEKSQVIVVNHALLLFDLQAKKNQRVSTLPAFSRLIIDEAHHLESAATKCFANDLATKNFFRLLNRLITEGVTGRKGPVNMLADAAPDLLMMKMELTGEKRDVADRFNELFLLWPKWLGNEGKRRLHGPIEPLIPYVERAVNQGRRFCQLLNGLEERAKKMEEQLPRRSEGYRFEIQSLTNRLVGWIDLIDRVLLKEADPLRVRWIERDAKDVRLIDAPLDVSHSLKEQLFDKMQSTTLLSATLASHKEFSFLKGRLGIEGEPIESIYPSPFNYKDHSLFIVPKDLPPPEHPFFLRAAKEIIFDAIDASRGRAFILFTSYTALIACYEEMKGQLKDFTLFKQGDSSRRDLLQKFKEAKRPILFGTDSFWEGVDIAGEQLSLVVIYKLPFAAPKEPLVEAQGELYKSPFFEYHLPKAVVKFKQGFGRLIRHHQDRGIVLCLDPRIKSKPYGNSFLKSLPGCEIKVTENQEHVAIMKRFYGA